MSKKFTAVALSSAALFGSTPESRPESTAFAQNQVTVEDSPELNASECAELAVNPELMPAAGGKFVGKEFRHVDLNSIDVEDLPEECDKYGVRSLYTYVQYKEGGKFRKASGSIVVRGNDAGTYNGTVKVRKLKPIKGPRNRPVRLGYRFMFDSVDNVADRQKRYYGPRWNYGPGGDGI